MKIRLENLEKKIITSDKNQPRIYLAKHEAQQFDLARSIFITIEQEDYSVVDEEIVELLNGKLTKWFEKQGYVPFTIFENYLLGLMNQHKFEEVARNNTNIAFVRHGKYLNTRIPADRNQIRASDCGFNVQIEWLKNDSFRFNFVLDSSNLREMLDFEIIMKEVYAKGMIISGVITNQDGEIVHSSENWSLNADELKTCIERWQGQWRHVTLQNVRYAMVFSQPDYFSAVNSKDKTWLVGAVSPESAGEKFFVLGLTKPGTDGKNAYVDIAKAANRIKIEDDNVSRREKLEKATPLSKIDYEVMIALEKQLGIIIPVVKKVDYMTFGCVINNKHVVALGLYGQKIQTLPETIGDLKYLQSLYLWNNRLNSLPEIIGKLMALKELCVTSNNISSLPESIGNLRRLTYLNLNSNSLTSLPDTIGNLTELRDLRLYSNHLQTLPESIGNLTRLNVLWAQENKLVALPNTIGNLKELRILSAGGNRLTALPESIGQLSALKQLNLSANPFTSLPNSLGNLSSLEELVIDTDGTTPLPLPETIVRLKALKNLDLGGTKVLSLPEPIRKAIKTLQEQGCTEMSYIGIEGAEKGKINQLEEKIIQAWEALSPTQWDDEKATEIIGWIKTGGLYILDSKKHIEIKYILVQSSIEFKNIIEWRGMDENKDFDLVMNKLVELHDRLEGKRQNLHPSIWIFLKEAIQTKSNKFQKKIPFNY